MNSAKRTRIRRIAPPGADLNALVVEAVKEFAGYQRLTGEGNLGELAQDASKII